MKLGVRDCKYAPFVIERVSSRGIISELLRQLILCHGKVQEESCKMRRNPS